MKRNLIIIYFFVFVFVLPIYVQFFNPHADWSSFQKKQMFDMSENYLEAEINDFYSTDIIVFNFRHNLNQEYTISYITSGGQLLNYTDDNRGVINCKFQIFDQNSSLSLSLIFENEQISESVYLSLSKDAKFFSSALSKDDANFKRLAHEYYSDMISFEVYEQSILEINNSAVQISTPMTPASINPMMIQPAINEPSKERVIDVVAAFTWDAIGDNGSTKIKKTLSYVRVDVMNKFNNELYETKYTCENGEFSSYYFSSIKQTLKMRVYAGNDDVKVVDNSGRDYFIELDLSDFAVLNDLLSIEVHLPMSSDCNKAFQIAQAGIYGANYATYINNGIPLPSVTINYPVILDNGANASYLNNEINLSTNQIGALERNPETQSIIHKIINMYACWDVILHEYGHHISDYFNLSKSIGGDYLFGDLLVQEIVEYDENQQVILPYDNIQTQINILGELKKSNDLVWSEGLATYFSVITQEFFKNEISDIFGVANGYYKTNNLFYVKAEFDRDSFGQTKIETVFQLLSILTIPNDSYCDLLILDKDLWDLIIEYNITNVSDFATEMSYKTENMPIYWRLLGDLGISPSNIVIKNEVSANVPPTIEWIVGGNPLAYNNLFYLTVLNNKNEIIIHKKLPEFYLELNRVFEIIGKGQESLIANTYSFSIEEWRKILEADGDAYSIEISASYYPTIYNLPFETFLSYDVPLEDYLENRQFTLGYFFSGYYIFSKPSQYNNEYLIRQSDYLYPDAYPTEAITDSHEIGGLSFTTSRLRAGYIQKKYIVLSPTRKNAGKAFIEYEFSIPVNEISIELGLWSIHEEELSSAVIEIKDSSGVWIPKLDLLNEIELKAYSIETYRMKFDEPITDFRIVSTSDVENASDSENLGRITIGIMRVLAESKASSISINKTHYGFNGSYSSYNNKNLIIDGTNIKIDAVRAGLIEGNVVLSAAKSGINTASLAYNFVEKDIYEASFDLSLWGTKEGAFNKISIQYLNSLGKWVDKLVIDYRDLPTDKTLPNTYSVIFSFPIASIRLYIETNGSNSSSNSGRIVISNATFACV